MLITEGPLPVAFDCNGESYLCEKSVLSGKNARRVLAMIHKTDNLEPRGLKAEDVLEACSDTRYQPAIVQLCVTKEGAEITREEADAICNEMNIVEVSDMLLQVSGWEQIKNSLEARLEKERLAREQKNQSQTPNNSIETSGSGMDGPTSK